MSRFDSFFEAPEGPELQNKIREKAENELAINRQSFKRRRFVAWFAPSLAAVAASLAFVKFNYFSSTDERASDSLAQFDDLDVETLNRFASDSDGMQIVEDLLLLEDLEDLELIEDESLES